MSANAVHDVADLKEKIRRLRATRAEYEQERKTLEEESSRYENQLSSLRQELNIIGNIDTLQCHASDEFTDEFNPEAMRKFKSMNDKLDMKILNQEIRAALPQLEREAKTWEAKAKGKLKSITRNERNQMLFPSMMLNSQEEIEEQIGVVLDEKYRIKSLISHDIAVQKKEKIELCTEIANLRRRLSVLSEEEMPLQMAHTRLKVALLLEGITTKNHQKQ
jgi:hypothetical protein